MLRLSFFAVLMLLGTSIVQAQTTFTVTTTDDSGAGSLRQAILDANANAGADVISFDIPGAGPHTIRPLSEMPEVTSPVMIDGLTQPGAACAAWPPSLLVELDGSRAGAGADGLRITAGNSTVRGLVVNRFGSDGIDLQDNGGNTIACNFLGTDPSGTLDRGNGNGDGVDVKSSNNLIGSADGVMGNLASGSNNQGIRIAGEDVTGNVVRGNRVGTDVSGTVALGNTFAGIIIDGASDTTVGGTAAGDGNLISGNRLNGIEIEETGFLADNRIQGNYIGTDVTGQATLGNEEDGILLDRAAYTVIGGDTPEAGNVISGNGDDGIDVFGAESEQNVIQYNSIGVAADGTTPLGNAEDGIDLNDQPAFNEIRNNVIAANADWGIYINSGARETSVARNYIGTNEAGDALGNGLGGLLAEDSGPQIIGGTYGEAGACCEGNTIAFNEGPGIGVRVTTTVSVEKGIRGNRIYANDGLGIDLRLDGVTPNDPQDQDGDDQPNRLQNFPVLTAPMTGSQEVEGTLNSRPDASFRIDVYASETCDPSGYGEGQLFLGTVTVQTDGNGDAAFALALDSPVAPGTVYTATAINGEGNTSEFAACVVPANAPPTAPQIVQPADGAEVFVGGAPGEEPRDPGATLTVAWAAATDPEGDAVAYTWELAPTQDFAAPLLTQEAGSATELAFTLAELAAVLDAAAVTEATLYHRAIASDGMAETAGPAAEVRLVRGALVDADANDWPEAFALAANYPNPFNPQTTIRYALPQAAEVRLVVYDVLGREVAVLVDGMRPAGRHQAVFEAANLPSGVYLYRLDADSFTQTRRMLLVK
ncbi:MAG: T9SS type A sorting domain-containing protein [Bacteroidetes bacterium]|jgi:hypothetical protein|nr:T9SS type A sorting domain-containing protein [Bacteroidota bacterium]